MAVQIQGVPKGTTEGNYATVSAVDGDHNAIDVNVIAGGGITVNADTSDLLGEGAPITGESLEAGGSSALGWFASLRKAITDRLPAALVGGRLDVNVGAGTVTAAQATAASLNATVVGGGGAALATAAGQPGIGTAGTPHANVMTVQGIASGTEQPVSVAALPLPTGAATAAKQPALGTAGTASAEVLTVQGIAAMTPLLVNASGAAVTVVQGTAGSAAWLVDTARGGALTDASGTCADGNSHQLLAANNARRYLIIQNLASSANLWFNFGTAAVASQPSIRLAAGRIWESPAHFCPTGTVNALGTTGETFVCKEA